MVDPKSISLMAVRPVIGAIASLALPKVKTVFAERKAANEPASSSHQLLELGFKSSYARITSGVETDGWWSGFLHWAGHKVVAPEFFNIESIQEWLKEPEVEKAFFCLARELVMHGKISEGENAECALLPERFEFHTGDRREYADSFIDVVLAVIAAGHFASLNPGQEKLAGMVQDVSSSVERGFAETKDQLDFLASQRDDDRAREIRNSNHLSEIRKILSEGNTAQREADLASDTGRGENSSTDKVLNDIVDQYRDQLIDHQPRTALKQLQTLRTQQWASMSNWLKFRVLTNIASCLLALEEYPEAKSLLLEAYDYAPDDELANCNLSLGYLLVGEREAAHNYAEAAIKRFPESGRAYALLVSSFDGSEPERLVPEDLFSDDQVTFSICRWYQGRDDAEKAKHWAHKALDCDPERLEVRATYAETMLQPHVEDESIRIGGQVSLEARKDIEIAIKHLADVWDIYRQSELAEQNVRIALNLSNAWRLLGNLDCARKYADQAITSAPNSLIVKVHDAQLRLQEGDPNGAITKLKPKADSLTDDADVFILLAQAYLDNSDKQLAVDVCNKYINHFPDGEEIELISGMRAYTACSMGNADIGKVYISENLEKWPSSIWTLLQSVDAYRAIGDTDAALACVDDVNDLLGHDASFYHRLLVAEAYFKLSQYEKAATSYSSLVTIYDDTPIVRHWLISLFETEQRHAFQSVIRCLSKAVLAKRFFRKINAQFLLKTGDLNGAKIELEKYLELTPNDLGMRVNWIGVLVRLGREDEICTFLEKAPNYPDADPGEQMNFVQILDKFGYSKEALIRGYDLVKRYWSKEPSVHLRYLGLCLEGQVTPLLQAPTKVEPDCSVVLSSDHAADFEITITRP